ncbi:S-adenosyl-L-methionine-dependent methyltransferase [Amylocystis lapponica]|nr:S-adenosyl-L-methionine-dependent methyltransferase [Amylocystis lapponica]
MLHCFKNSRLRSGCYLARGKQIVECPSGANGLRNSDEIVADPVLGHEGYRIMDASASIYSGFVLRVYDFVVLTFSNYWLWRCPTGSVLLPFFRQHLGESAHLDIGVGSGYYPTAAARALADVKNITLLDLNPSALAYAARRLRSARYTGEVIRVEHNIFDPVPEALRGQFDAVSFFYVFHCLPGALPDKARKVSAAVVPALAPGGVVYGATILGRRVRGGPSWRGTTRRAYLGTAEKAWKASGRCWMTASRRWRCGRSALLRCLRRGSRGRSRSSHL